MYVYLVWKSTSHMEEVVYIYRTRERAEECMQRCYSNVHDPETVHFSVQEKMVQD